MKRREQDRRAREIDVIGTAGRTSPASSGFSFDRATPKVDDRMQTSKVEIPPPWMCAVEDCATNNYHARETCHRCGAKKGETTRPAPRVIAPPKPTGENWKDVRKDFRRPTQPERPRLPAHMDTPPVARGSQTSARAAERILPTFGTKMFLVHEHIKAERKRGATREEISTALAMRLSTVCGAVRKLYLMGFIGSNCVHECETLCDHDVVSRPGTSGLDNEVMVDELYVKRWAPEQSRGELNLSAALENEAKRTGGFINMEDIDVR